MKILIFKNSDFQIFFNKITPAKARFVRIHTNLGKVTNFMIEIKALNMKKVMEI